MVLADPILLMATRINRERPEWRIRPARSDSPDRDDLSKTGVVWDQGQGLLAKIGTFNITFDQSLVDDLGKALQFGVSSAFPVFLKVVRLVPDGQWSIRARYARRARVGKHETTLWSQPEPPEWIKVKWCDEQKAQEESSPFGDRRTEDDDCGEGGDQEEDPQSQA